MISKDLAEKFIERVMRHTNYNVNIMDENGIIIASRDMGRVGQYHEVAYRIITGTQDIVDTTDMAYPNVRPGINMVIEVDKRREGIVGVTGDPKEIRPVALIVKMAIETMLKYERQQEQIRLRANKKEHFIYLLTQVENADPEQLRSMANDLGYPEEMIRIPILIQTDDTDSSFVLHVLRNSQSHTRKDFSFALNASRVLVFKTMPNSSKELFSEYKYIIQEYLSPFLRWLRDNGRNAAFYVGSFQNTYPQYYYAYRHCRWLEQNVAASGQPVFFYDYAGDYLKASIPMGELQRVFYVYRSRIPPEKLRTFMDVVGMLIRTNFNFNRASELLHIHKNTLVYRYNNLKELLNLDPVASAGDRASLEAFYGYLQRCSDI